MDHLTGRQGNQRDHGDTGRWVFTGDLRDNGRFDSRCDWCDKQGLRITFAVTGGSEDEAGHICQACIGSGPVHVEHEGRVLEGQERRHHLAELAMRLKHRTCRDVLRNLLTLSDDPALREVAVYFDRNMQLSPSRAATLLLALSASGLGPDPAIFEVQIRSTAHRQEFGGLTEREKLALWPILSPAIRNRLVWLGSAPARHAAPRPSRARARPAALHAQP